jgi:multiple RNA-binding domain-containing protein 1
LRTTIFVKNLNFKTSNESLKRFFETRVGSLKSATVVTKRKNGRQMSLGYGFVECRDRDQCAKALRVLGNKRLDGHELKLQLANATAACAGESKTSHAENESARVALERRKRQRQAAAKRKPTAKLLVRNVAFEASRRDIQILFSTFGQLKSVRLPKKFDHSHRGFAFVEFLTKQEAKSAFNALQNSHLYGRHLVIEYAKEDDAFSVLEQANIERPAQVLGDSPSKSSKSSEPSTLASKPLWS